MNNIDLLLSSSNFDKHNLPEPYHDDGYFFVYYNDLDYKYALTDIVKFINSDMRIYYDRKLEYGPAWEDNLISKAKSFSCRAVIFYLSENVLKDEFFWKLLNIVKDKHIHYASINIDKDNKILMPEDIISSCDVDDNKKLLFNEMFNKDITFIPYSSTFEDKIKGLDSIGSNDPLIYNYGEGIAKVIGVKSLSEERIIIPEKVVFNNTEYEVREIGPSAFKGCMRLKSIIIPNTIKHLGYTKYGQDLPSDVNGMVFDKCESLKEVVIPDSVEELCMNNFTGCKNLKRIVVGNGIKKIHFWGDIPRFDIINDYEYAKGDEDVHLHLDELVLTKSFKHLNDDYYFDGVDGYIRLDLSNINSIIGCEELSQIKEYISDGSPILNRFESDEAIEKVDLSNMDCIDFISSFSGCINLKELILPNSAKTIYMECDYCDKLEKLVIGNNVERIENLQLYECKNLKSLLFPKNINYINLEDIAGLDNLDILIFDNKNADELLKSVCDIKMVYRDQSRSIMYKIFYPFIIWFTFFLMIFSKYFYVAIFAFIFFPISVPIMLFKKKINPLKNIKANKIYIKDYNKKIKVEKYKKVESDKDGYLLFVRK